MATLVSLFCCTRASCPATGWSTACSAWCSLPHLCCSSPTAGCRASARQGRSTGRTPPRALCRSALPALNELPGHWLARCLQRVVQPGQQLEDIIRRSAGLPPAVGALLRAEPSNAPKVCEASPILFPLGRLASGPFHFRPQQKREGLQAAGAGLRCHDLRACPQLRPRCCAQSLATPQRCGRQPVTGPTLCALDP